MPARAAAPTSDVSSNQRRRARRKVSAALRRRWQNWLTGHHSEVSCFMSTNWMAAVNCYHHEVVDPSK